MLLLVALGVVTRQPVAGPRAVLPPAADPGRLEADVRALSTAMLPRDAEHPENLDRAARHIVAALKAAGARPIEQEYSFEEPDRRNRIVRRGPFRNVIASFGPETGERLVVGAHYDAYGPFPAADDNASGTAGLLELARLLARRPPELRTDLVFYTLEEPPYFATDRMGSVEHASSLAKSGTRVRAMLSLEMIGYFSDEPGSQSYPLPLLRLFYPGTGDFISVVGRLGEGSLARAVKKAMRAASPLPVYSISAPAAIPGVDYSDHRSYWARGWPAVMITDSAFYRNRSYHTPRDDASALDYARMAQVVDGARAAVDALARDP